MSLGDWVDLFIFNVAYLHETYNEVRILIRNPTIAIT